MKKSVREIVGFNDLWFMILGIPILSILIPLLFFNPGFEFSFQQFIFSEFPIALIYCMIFWLGGRWILIQLRRRKELHGQETQRVALELIVVSVLIIGTNLFLGVVLDLCGLSKEKIDFRTSLVTSLTITYLVVFIYESIYFYQKWRETLIEKERFKQAALQSQLDGLKAHINPHFLFNSLNTVTYTIRENPERAVSLVQNLAKVYRFILEVRQREVISLEEELRFLHNYLFLLKERFEENLQVDIDIPGEVRQGGIPPLALQMLVENAIKHNVISTKYPLQLDIRIVKDRIVVKNNLQLKNQPADSTGFGLENIKSRYHFFTQEEVEVITTEQSFVVTLPLLKLPKEEALTPV